MNTGRLIVAGIVGGGVMFVWGAVSHMALPLGEMGISSLPNEDVMVPAMRAAISQRGFYAFPAWPEGELSEAETRAWEEKYRAGPRGTLIYDTGAAELMSPRQLGTECASNALAAFLAAIVLAGIPGSRGKRAFHGLLLGLVGWLSIDVSYWNWYRFPDLFTLAQLIDQGAGWLLTGTTVALILGRHQSAIEQPAR